MQEKTFLYESMGTTWKVSVWDEVNALFFAELKEEVLSLSKEFDETYSRFIPDSLISELEGKTGVFEVPRDLTAMLTMYADLCEKSGKKLNPLIGHTISDLGYDMEYSLTPKSAIRKTPDLFETIRIVDDYHIEIKKPALIDIGALGKGYFVDVIKELLVKHGFRHFLVDGSGDIYYSGPSLLVALEDPRDQHKAIGQIEIKKGALCGSGISKRAWREYHHVIDPETSLPTRGVIATWVLADTAALADALASCLFFKEPEAFREYTFEYLIMNDEGKIKRSAGFDADLFHEEEVN